MKKLIRIVSVITLTSGLLNAGCAQQSTQKERDEMDRRKLSQQVDDEVMVGRQIAARLLGHFGAYESSPQALAYVNLVGQVIASQSGRPELQFRFGILNVDAINAYACPGGFIFVTKGLLKTVKSEAELAAALAHEVAHVNEKHMYNEIAPEKEMTSSETLVRLMSRGKSDIGGNLATMVDGGMKMLLEKGLGPEREQAGDRAGVLYAAAAGYDPLALRDLVKRMEGEAHTPNIGKTHPPFGERIAQLDKFIADNGFSKSTKAGSAVLNKRFNEALRSGKL
ncbi:MAG: hypothetical protein A2X94_04050 [Bdellovibrionales bacterium GWB1_55_8]|nr:MAG: hypothetical protein A2X94_04050 [Bdellovibrionales bacterium GWB1_55_8]